MKMTHILKSAALVALGLALFSCSKKEELKEARAVAASDSYLEFASVNAPEKTLSVYSDGAWAVDVADEWISVSPTSGKGAMDIVISVADNATGGVVDLPRDGKITIQGGSRERNAVITIHQDGDTYYGVQTYTLAQIRDLEDKDVAKVAEAQAIALSKDGFIAADESGFLYVKGEGVALGDKISFNGAKNTLNEGAAFVLDEFTVIESQAAVVYPTATDITASLGSFDFAASQFVTLSASLIGTNVYVNQNVQFPLLGPLEAFELGKLDLHKVTFTGFNVGKSLLLTAVSDNGADEALIPYPLKFKVRVEDINYTTASFAEDSRIDPVNGLGYIEYVPFDLAGTDDNKKYKLDVSDKSPRVTGPWPGDYWLFYGNGAIKAGSEVRIAFEARTSATGHKFWMLEFLDGTEWRPACEVLSSSESGEEVQYTHAMNADGATNVQADYTVKYRKNTEHAQFRFRCMANWQASGAGALPARNGGSARLTVTDVADDTYQPTIEIIKEGNGVEKDPVYAEIEVSSHLLTFNGTPDAPKTITVTSDHDFTLSSQADWLSFDVTEGLAGEATDIQVTCAPSELSELRQATIKIVSEDSEKVIDVVQSAAGQQLDPFISVTGGNRIEVVADGGTKTLRIQSNVEVSAESLSSEWLSVEKAGTKAMVEGTEFVVTYAANDLETGRSGQVRFYNEEKNLEAVVTFVQAGKEPEPLYPEGVYFQDDFDWFKDIADAAGAGDGVGTKTSDAVAPNVYTFDETGTQVFLSRFAAKGYEDLNAAAKVMYLQKYYLKFSKGKNVGGIRLPKMAFGSTPKDVVLEFDWCAQMGGSGSVDAVSMNVEVTGAGLCADSNAAVSSEYPHSQQTGEMFWQHVKIVLKGVTDDTRIEIKPKQFGATSGYYRFFLDNIKVADPAPAVDDVLWSENWVGGVAGDTPSVYQGKDGCSTVVFNNGSVTYSQNSNSTKLYEDGLVYYNNSANISEEAYRNNLMISKGSGFFDVAGIPCKGVKTAQLTYRSNTKVSVHKLESPTTGVTLSELAGTQTNKLDVDDAAQKYINTITCTITLAEGVDSLDLKFINTSAGSNIRVDGFELKVTELW